MPSDSSLLRVHHPHHRRHRGRARRGNEEARPRSRRCDDEPGDGWRDDACRRPRHRRERHRYRDERPVRQQAREERRPRRFVERLHQPDHHCRRCQVPHHRLVGHREHGEGHQHGNGGRLRSNNKCPGVEAVGEHATGKVHNDARGGADEVDESQGQRRLRQVIRQPPEGDDGHLLAGDLCDQPYPEEPEVPVAQRGEELDEAAEQPHGVSGVSSSSAAGAGTPRWFLKNANVRSSESSAAFARRSEESWFGFRNECPTPSYMNSSYCFS